jgi:hypothetical protein
VSACGSHPAYTPRWRPPNRPRWVEASQRGVVAYIGADKYVNGWEVVRAAGRRTATGRREDWEVRVFGAVCRSLDEGTVP